MAEPIIREGRVLHHDTGGFQPVAVCDLLVRKKEEARQAPRRGAGPGEAGHEGGSGQDSGLVEAQLREAEKEAERILQRAREEAAQIISQARRQAAEAVEAAVAEERRRAVEQLAETLEKIKSRWEEARRQMIDQIVPVAMEVARKILSTELQTRPEIVAEMARKVLQQAGGGRVRLVVSARDAEVVERAREMLKAAVGGTQELEIVIDPDMESGDVVVQTDQGDVDGRIETQLQAIARQLEEMKGELAPQSDGRAAA